MHFCEYKNLIKEVFLFRRLIVIIGAAICASLMIPMLTKISGMSLAVWAIAILSILSSSAGMTQLFFKKTRISKLFWCFVTFDMLGVLLIVAYLCNIIDMLYLAIFLSICNSISHAISLGYIIKVKSAIAVMYPKIYKDFMELVTFAESLFSVISAIILTIVLYYFGLSVGLIFGAISIICLDILEYRSLFGCILLQERAKKLIKNK